jgi:hypothetical protein
MQKNRERGKLIMIEAEKEEIDEFAVLTNVNIRAKNAAFAKVFGLENTIVETCALVVRERAGINCRKSELPGKDEAVVCRLDHSFNLAHYIDFLKRCKETGVF